MKKESDLRCEEREEDMPTLTKAKHPKLEE